MIKIFLPKGLSARVRGAIARRLQSAMAVRADTAETTVEEGTSEIPARGVEQADAELQEAPIPATEEKEDDIGLHGSFTWSAAESREDRLRERSRSPVKGTSLPSEVPSTMEVMPQAPLGEGSMPSVGLEVTPEQASVLKEAMEHPKTALEVLQACTDLSVGITTLVASLKATHTQGINILQEQSQTRGDLARSLDLVARAITRQATACESLVAGVNSNTSRVGAVSGETNKVRTWLQWAMPRPLPESAKRLEELLVAHGEKSEQAMQELAKEFSTELQTVGSKIVTELKGVIEAIQKIGVESTQDQPDVSAGNPFGLEAIGGEVAAGLGFPPQMPSTFCVTTTPSTYGQARAMPSIVGCSALGADDSSDDDAIAGDTQRW